MDLYLEFQQVKSDLATIIELLQSKDANSGTMKMYDLADLQQLLNVSRRTIATWTKEGTLAHVKVGNKLWVSEEQLTAFLEKHRSDAINDFKIRKGGNYGTTK